MNRIFYSILAVFLIIGGLAIFQATKESSAQVLLPSDLLAKGNDMKRIRVGGRVANAEVSYAVEPTFELKFRIENPGGKDAGASGTIPVVYNGIKPDMFASGRDIIIDGEFSKGVLLADKLLTQCPSKYEPPSAEDVYNKRAQEKK